MAGFIPKNFISELLARVDVVAVIGARLSLRKAGGSFVTCCPFHQEKSPSFNVNSRKQFYYCFGCGKTGNAISFLMDYEHLTFVEAVSALADDLGLTIPWEGGHKQAPKHDYEPLYQVLEQATDYYQSQLKTSPVAQNYLKKRQISAPIIETFRLGFAPPGWDNLLRHVNAVEALNQAGMLSTKEGSDHHYDRFRERIMFPIQNLQGRIIGFGGRVLTPDASPKYLNSPETPIFHKGSELYGLYQAQQAHRNLAHLLVVEGYMDLVALAQYGITNAVATLGTATTHLHIERLFRYTDTVIFCFDGDNAGKNAAWRALQTLLKVLTDGRTAKFVFLPEGEDPDSMVRKEGVDNFINRLEHATPLSTFFFNWLRSSVDTTNLDGRARVASLANPLIEQIPAGFFQQMMQAELAKITHLNNDLPRSTPQPPKQFTPLKAQPITPRLTPLKLVIALLLQNPPLARLVDAHPLPQGDINLPGFDILKKLIHLINNDPHLTTSDLLEQWPDPTTQPHLAKLAFCDHLLTDDAMPHEFQGALKRIHHLALEKKIDTLIQKGAQLTEEEKRELNQLIGELQRLR